MFSIDRETTLKNIKKPSSVKDRGKTIVTDWCGDRINDKNRVRYI